MTKLKKISIVSFLSVFCILSVSNGKELSQTQAEKTDSKEVNKINNLINQLGSSNWRVREEAHIKLEKHGRAAVPALKAALKASDPEIVFRSEKILSKIDPFEAALILLGITIPTSSPGKWYINEIKTFQGTTGQISFPGFGNYHFSMKQDLMKTDQLTLSTTSLGTLDPVKLDFSSIQPETFQIIEKRIQIKSFQQGLYMEIEQTPSMLIAWTKTGLRSQLNKDKLPINSHTQNNHAREQFLKLLFDQLSQQDSRTDPSPLIQDSRASAGEILSLLGEKKALPLIQTLHTENPFPTDIALARLGSDEAHPRLLNSIKENQNLPRNRLASYEALLVLAELGNTTALDLLIKRIEKLSNYNFKRTALLAANQLLKSQNNIDLLGKKRLVTEAMSPLRSSWQQATRFLLHTIARQKESAIELLLPLLKDLLANNSSSTNFSTSLYILRVIIANFPLPRETVQEISTLAAAHCVNSNWQKVITTIPYLVKSGGSSMLRPFITRVSEVLETSKPPYSLKKILIALAMVAPAGSQEHKELVELLSGHLKIPPDTITRTVSEPLSILLKNPVNTLSSTSIKQLIEASKGGSIKQALPGYQLFLWNVQCKDGKINIQEHFYFNIKAMESFSFKDNYGNRRFLAIYPQTSLSNTSVRLLTPGASTYIKLQEPSLRGIFPDVDLKNVYQSNLILNERFQRSDDFQDIVVFIKQNKPSVPGKEMSWEEMINQSVNNLLSSNQTSFRTSLKFFSKLKVRQAIPRLKQLFQETKNELIASTLIQLGDKSGELFLLKNIQSKERKKRLNSVKYLLKVVPDSKEAILVLAELIRTNKQRIEVYTLTSCARSVLKGHINKKLRQLLLHALVSILTPENAMSIIPTLRTATGLNFGFYESLRLKDQTEKTKQFQKIIQSWKQRFINNPTDKK